MTHINYTLNLKQIIKIYETIDYILKNAMKG